MMNTRFEDQYEDVLHNIEHIILALYRQAPDITDHTVDKAMEGLLRRYQMEQKGRPTPPSKLNEIEAQLYEGVEVVCEIALNRLEAANRDALAVPTMQTITLEELIACLKRIRSSISLWTKDYGRRGYLDFIADFDV
jgi:hypothetical protein